MTRKRNVYFGFGPAKKSERLTVYRRPKQQTVSVRQKFQRKDGSFEDLKSALVNLGYPSAKARVMAKSARGDGFDSKLRDALKRNPLGGIMAQKKRRSKKKRNGRKGKMPAGLKEYWAKKRRAKAKRRNPTKRKRTRSRRRRPAVRRRRSRAGRYDQRLAEVVAAMRRRNPRRKSRRKSKPRRSSRTPVVNLGSGVTPKQIKKVGRIVARRSLPNRRGGADASVDRVPAPRLRPTPAPNAALRIPTRDSRTISGWSCLF